MKEQKGITLVALVITIIILLILAGISIATLSGDNGLFKRAQQAKDATVNGQKNENAALDTYNAAINNAIKGLSIE
ncbi:MAG: hypothetical protein V8R82_04910 [Clostridia bacterium]